MVLYPLRADEPATCPPARAGAHPGNRSISQTRAHGAASTGHGHDRDTPTHTHTKNNIHSRSNLAPETEVFREKNLEGRRGTWMAAVRSEPEYESCEAMAVKPRTHASIHSHGASTRRKQRLTVRFLSASARTRASKLLGLAPTRVGDKQAAVVGDEGLLDLLLLRLINVCEATGAGGRNTAPASRLRGFHQPPEGKGTSQRQLYGVDKPACARSGRIPQGGGRSAHFW